MALQSNPKFFETQHERIKFFLTGNRDVAKKDGKNAIGRKRPVNKKKLLRAEIGR